MAISEAQLTTWSNQGALVSSAQTYNSIKTCIDGGNWNADVKYEIYLQGSYRNATNTRGDSDVDIVVEFTSTFYSNKAELSAAERMEYDEYFNDAKYSLSDFKSAIVQTLEGYYGKQNVEVGSKSIKIKGINGRLNADVVCCASYRRYSSFSKAHPSNYVKGIVFWDGAGNRVVNYPKKHFDNGASKNSSSSMNYKPTVRVLKNIKSKLVSEGLISASLAPSYFIECLLYNVPNAVYIHKNYQDRVVGILNHFVALNKANGFSDLVCQNRQMKLFGNSDQQWSEAEAKEFLQAVINYYYQ